MWILHAVFKWNQFPFCSINELIKDLNLSKLKSKSFLVDRSLPFALICQIFILWVLFPKKKNKLIRNIKTFKPFSDRTWFWTNKIFGFLFFNKIIKKTILKNNNGNGQTGTFWNGVNHFFLWAKATLSKQKGLLWRVETPIGKSIGDNALVLFYFTPTVFGHLKSYKKEN